MYRWVTWSVLLVVPALVAGCPTGKSPLDRRDTQRASDGPVPIDNRVDSKADTKRLADAKQLADARQHRDAKPQGTSCTSNGVTFNADVSPKPCGTVDLTAEAPIAWVNIGGGVKDALGKVIWMPPDLVIKGPPCPCSWGFKALPVPCTGAVGPFSFNLMKDAVGNDWTKGNIAASCIP